MTAPLVSTSPAGGVHGGDVLLGAAGEDEPVVAGERIVEGRQHARAHRFGDLVEAVEDGQDLMVVQQGADGVGTESPGPHRWVRVGDPVGQPAAQRLDCRVPVG
jgi:hypothetical protein